MSEFYTDKPPMVIHEWLRERIKLHWSTDFKALARVVDREIVGAVAYCGFTGTACEMHMAGNKPGWFNREFIRLAFRYPFEILDLKMVFGKVPSGNTRALDIDLRLGFKEILYIDGAHPDGGLHILQLKREDWMRTKYGRQSTRRT